MCCSLDKVCFRHNSFSQRFTAHRPRQRSQRTFYLFITGSLWLGWNDTSVFFSPRPSQYKHLPPSGIGVQPLAIVSVDSGVLHGISWRESRQKVFGCFLLPRKDTKIADNLSLRAPLWIHQQNKSVGVGGALAQFFHLVHQGFGVGKEDEDQAIPTPCTHSIGIVYNFRFQWALQPRLLFKMF